jgi:hypothetical protein
LIDAAFIVKSSGWTDYANQLSSQNTVGGQGGMNASGESAWIGVITGANDDSGVRALGFPVQADKVESVQGEHGANLIRGEGQDLIIRDFLIGTSGFVGSQDVVSESSEFFNDPFGEVLIGVERGHQAS